MDSPLRQLLQAIASAKAGDPLRPVTVIAPSHHGILFLRQALVPEGSTEGATGLINVRLLTISNVAEMLGGPSLAAAGRLPLTQLAAGQACAFALRAVDNPFQSLLRNPQAKRQLTLALSKIEQDGLEPPESLLLIAEAFRKATHGLYSNRELAEAAATAIKEHANQYADLGKIIEYLPQDAPDYSLLVTEIRLSPENQVIKWLTTAGEVNKTPLVDGCRVVTDAEQEVRTAISEIGCATVPLHRTAIITTDRRKYAPLLEDYLHAAKIPYHGGQARTLEQTMPAKCLTRLLRLFEKEYRDFELRDFLSLVSSDLPDAFLPFANWERGLNQLAVSHHLSRWQRALVSSRQSTTDPEFTARFTDLLGRLTDCQAGLSACSSWHDYAEWAIHSLAVFIGRPTRASLSEAERADYQAVVDALEQLSVLQKVNSLLQLEDFCEAVAELCSKPASGNPPFGTGVYCGTLHGARGMNFEKVFILGMVDGNLPRPPQTNPFLPGQGPEPSQDLREFEEVVASASQAIICFPRVDAEGVQENVPCSAFLQAVAKLVGQPFVNANELRKLAEDCLDGSIVEYVSFTDSLKKRMPASLQEWNLQALFEAAEPTRTEFNRGFELERLRQLDHLTVAEGLAPIAMPSLSASKLEDLAKCPYRFFLKHGLGLKDPQGETIGWQLDARERGSLYHAILSEFYETLSVKPLSSVAWDEAASARICSIAVAHCDAAESAGLVEAGPEWTVAKENLLLDLQAFLMADSVFRATSGTPTYFEQKFSGVPLPWFEQTFAGKIDRIDVNGSEFNIVDYKTGSASPARIPVNNPLNGGQEVQLPLYALAVTHLFHPDHTVGIYWFVKGQAPKPDQKQFLEFTEEINQRFTSNLHVLHMLTETGAYPQVPGAPSQRGYTNCDHCDFNSICPSDREEKWRRVRHDSALLPYASMLAGPGSIAEPEILSPSAQEGEVPSDETEAPFLDDSAARHIIHHGHYLTIFVEAGAGTGKTTALIRRIVNIANHPNPEVRVPIEQIAAITFTEKAAGELNERLKLALEAAERDEPGPVTSRSVAHLGGAQISTLHGFCKEILNMFPLEAGLPPGFSIESESQSEAAFSDWWEAILERHFQSEAPSHEWESALRSGLKIAPLKNFAKRLNENWDRLSTQFLQVDFNLTTEFQNCIQEGQIRLEELPGCSDPNDKLQKICIEFREWLAKWAKADSNSEILTALRAIPKVKKVGNKAAWGGQVEIARERLTTFRQSLDHCAKQQRCAEQFPLLQRLVDEVLALASLRQQAGFLQFHDLLVLARNLLRDRPDVAKQVAARFRRLFVDEFQDTDPLQLQIVEMIEAASDGACQLFFVGDPKQSIYRFRRASMEVYRQAKNTYQVGIIQLSSNYRSHSSILNWVNRTFRELIGNEFRSLQAGRPSDDLVPERPRVRLIGGACDGASAEWRLEESAAVAGTIRTILEEKWPVGETRKPANLADIGILVPSRTILPELLRALTAAGIRFRVESKSLVFGTQAARDLLNILRAIDSPANSIAIVGALRSSGIGCLDTELVEYFSLARGWNYLEIPDLEGPPSVLEGLRRLAAWHTLRHTLSVGSLVNTIIHELQLLELGLAAPNPGEVWHHYAYFGRRARQFDADSRSRRASGSLQSFLRLLRLEEDSQTRAEEVVVPEVDDDGVRIMTIHAAKGLEFPITILAGLGTANSSDRGIRLAWSESGEMHLRIGSQEDRIETEGATAVFENDAREDTEEENRLLYVAATRAMDYLVVSLYRSSKARESLAHKIASVIPHDPIWSPPAYASRPPRIEQFLPRKIDSTEWLASRQIAFRLGSRRTVAATAIADRLHPLDYEVRRSGEDDEGIEAEDASLKRSRGSKFGRAVHATLQLVNLRTGEELEAIARSQAAEQGIENRKGELIRYVRTAIDSAELQAAIQVQSWRELYVSARVHGTLVHGFIDLLTRGPDGYHVIDYKTDAVRNNEDLAEKLERYRLQAGAYAVALGRTLGQVKVKCSFLFLASGQFVTINADDLLEAILQIENYLARPENEE